MRSSERHGPVIEVSVESTPAVLTPEVKKELDDQPVTNDRRSEPERTINQGFRRTVTINQGIGFVRGGVFQPRRPSDILRAIERMGVCGSAREREAIPKQLSRRSIPLLHSP